MKRSHLYTLGLICQAMTGPLVWAAFDLQPGWSKAGTAQEANASFLANTEFGTKSELQNEIFDPKLAVQMRQRYQDISREYELREQYGLTTPEEDRAYADHMASFTRDVLNEIRADHIARMRKDVEQNLKKDPNYRAVEKPVAVAAALAAVYYGEPVKMHMGDNTKVIAKTDVPNQKANLWLHSPVVNGGLDFTGRAPAARDPYAPVTNPDPTVKEERYRMSLSRDLPIWDLTSGLSYGSTTTMVTASLSKQVNDHVTCVVDSSHPMNSARTDLPNGQESVKVLYGIRF